MSRTMSAAAIFMIVLVWLLLAPEPTAAIKRYALMVSCLKRQESIASSVQGNLYAFMVSCLKRKESIASSVQGNLYYATESCGHVHGPDQLSVLEFDKEVDYMQNKPSSSQNLDPPAELRDRIWDCVIVVRGMPPATGKKFLGVQWRSFHIRDQDINTVEETVEDCGKAYVTMYKGSDTTGEGITMCGKDTTKTLFEWEGSYVTFKFYADFRRPGSLDPNCVDPDTVEDDAPTSLPLCEQYPYPEVHFRVDITSYDYDCDEIIPSQVLKCNDSQRCLTWDLLCDYYFSHNCKSPTFPEDKSDQTRDAPSYCFRKTTTTPIPTTTLPPPPPPFDWTPVAAPLGGLLTLLVMVWCCCRPGYLPWRLARLRNVPLFRNASTSICCRGPTKCCPCLKCCIWAGYEDAEYGKRQSLSMTGALMVPMALGKSPWGRRLKASGLANVGKKMMVPQGFVTRRVQLYPAQSYGKDPNNFATDWLNIISGDGGHLREHR